MGVADVHILNPSSSETRQPSSWVGGKRNAQTDIASILEVDVLVCGCGVAVINNDARRKGDSGNPQSNLT